MLEDLETTIEQKLTKKEIEEYQEHLRQTHHHIENHQEAFIGKSTNPASVYHIFTILRHLEKHIYRLMEEHKMFGYKEDDEGL